MKVKIKQLIDNQKIKLDEQEITKKNFTNWTQDIWLLDHEQNTATCIYRRLV